MTRRSAAVLLGVLAISLAGCGEQDGVRSGGTGGTGTESTLEFAQSGGCGDAYFWATTADDEHAVVVSVDLQDRSTSGPTVVDVSLPDPAVEIELWEGTGLGSLMCNDVIEGEVTEETPVVEGTRHDHRRSPAPRTASTSSTASSSSPAWSPTTAPSSPTSRSRPPASASTPDRAEELGSRSGARQLPLDELHVGLHARPRRTVGIPGLVGAVFQQQRQAGTPVQGGVAQHRPAPVDDPGVRTASSPATGRSGCSRGVPRPSRLGTGRRGPPSSGRRWSRRAAC